MAKSPQKVQKGSNRCISSNRTKGEMSLNVKRNPSVFCWNELWQASSWLPHLMIGSVITCWDKQEKSLQIFLVFSCQKQWLTQTLATVWGPTSSETLLHNSMKCPNGRRCNFLIKTEYVKKKSYDVVLQCCRDAAAYKSVTLFGSRPTNLPQFNGSFKEKCDQKNITLIWTIANLF